MRLLLRAALLAVIAGTGYLAPEPIFGQALEGAPPAGPSAP